MESSSSKWPPAAETAQFRLLCPAARTGAIIGKGGSVIRHLQSVTGAKIRVIDDIPVPSDERVVLIVSPTGKTHTTKKDEHVNDSENPCTEQKQNQNQKQEQGNENTETSGTAEHEGEEPFPAQMALVRVLERIVFGDDAAGDGDEVDNSESEGLCRMLVGGNQVAFLLGKGGRIMQKVRQETGANVRVLPKDQVPACAFAGDEVIQISGKFSAVKKALLLISHYLQGVSVHPTGEGCPFPQHGYPPDFYPADYHQRDYPPNPMPEDIRGYNRLFIEEEVVFKLLCKADKVGSLIGKGGSVVRAIQNETGASIKVADPTVDPDERVVVISARENSEQRHSPAQDAVMRVQNRIAEIGFEPSAAIVARLLVQSPHIGYLLGKGGHVITEMRRSTGASIRVFQKDQPMKYGSHRDEIVQIVGNLKTVQDALFQVTSRLRESMLPVRPPFSGMGGPPFMGPFPDVPPPFRPRPYPTSPGPYHSPIGSFHERHVGPGFDRPPSPMPWMPQAVGDGLPRGMADMNQGFALRSEAIGSENPALTSPMVEMVIPQAYLRHVYGENYSNLNYIKQMSGADVVVHDPKPGATEGVVVVSGTPDQTHFAQTLVHAVILCGQS